MADTKQPIIVVKKIVAGGHGHHGGAWKVAFADFMTAMMAFFLVMWLMGSDEEVTSSVEDFFQNPNSSFRQDSDAKDKQYMGGNTGDGDSIMTGLGGMMPDELVRSPRIPFDTAREPIPEYAQKLEQLSDSIEQMNQVGLENLQFVIPEAFLFKDDSTDFRTEGFEYLQHLQGIAKKHEGILQIEGFVYPEPKYWDRKDELYEFTLSRVVSVMAYFTKARLMTEERIQPIVNTDKKSPVQDRVIRFNFVTK